MDPRNKHAQCFYGTLEECLERYGGKSQFTVSAPLTFFGGDGPGWKPIAAPSRKTGNW